MPIRVVFLIVGVFQSACFQRFAAQGFQNYDFEVTGNENSLPIEWYIVEEDECLFESDSLVSFSGKLSFAVHPISPLKPCSATLLNDIEKISFKNKSSIRILMHVRSKDPHAEVSPFIRQLSKDGDEVQRKKGTPSQMAKIRSDWNAIVVEEKIEPSTEYMAFGVRTSSVNSIWVDAFEIYIDDEKLLDSDAPLTSSATSQQLNWLNMSVVSIDNLDAFEPAFLKKDLKNSRFVALGEETHGSSEIYQLKDQMVRFLVSNMNYHILALEMDMTDAEILNNYIANGNGDPRAILSQIGYWPYKTEEFLTLLKWLRVFNMNRDEKVKIVGFDIPSSDKALDPILEFSLGIDTSLYNKALELRETFFRFPGGKLEDVIAFDNQIDSLYVYLEKKKALLTATSNRDKYVQIKKKLLSLKQSAAYFRAKISGENLQTRDKHMAENISQFAKENKNIKIIIWAHNAHISTAEHYGAGMGRYLNSEFSIYSIGFSLGQGSFTGLDLTHAGGLGSYPLEPPIADSYESFFFQSKYPNFFLNLEGVNRVSENEWLFEYHKLRYIGAGINSRYQFVKTTLTENFDAVIFVRDSTPSHLLAK